MKPELDAQERLAFGQFLRCLEAESEHVKLVVNADTFRRGTDGQIIVPVTIRDSQPSAALAMLIRHKADQLYKQTACRFLLAQQPELDPKRQTYVWVDSWWKVLS